MQNMEVKIVSIASISPYEKNPRKNENAVDKVAASIKEFGFKQPIVIDKNRVIIAGHTRYKAALKLGYTEIPVVVADDLTDAQAKAYRLADNKMAEFSEWDLSLIAEELADLSQYDFDMSQFGFDEFHAEIQEDNFDVDTAYQEIEEPVTNPGDIWELGKHRLMCGDATEYKDIQTLMNGTAASMVWTDPPWNVDYGSSDNPKWKNGINRQILNDNMSTDAFREFLTKTFNNAAHFLQAGAMVYVAMSAQEWGNIMRVMDDTGYHWSSTIIWGKDQLVLSRKDYHTQYEPIWYGWKADAARMCPLDDRKQSDLWLIDRPKQSEEHPTMKPVELVARSIYNSSNKDDLILDLFGGSGTTLIAAEEAGRRCNMMELDPKYCDVIIKRWEALTGQKVVRINERQEALPVHDYE